MWIRIWDLDSFDPGSGIENFGSGIQDKHPRSATLVYPWNKEVNLCLNVDLGPSIRKLGNPLPIEEITGAAFPYCNCLFLSCPDRNEEYRLSGSKNHKRQIESTFY